MKTMIKVDEETLRLAKKIEKVTKERIEKTVINETILFLENGVATPQSEKVA